MRCTPLGHDRSNRLAWISLAWPEARGDRRLAVPCRLLTRRQREWRRQQQSVLCSFKPSRKQKQS